MDGNITLYDTLIGATSGGWIDIILFLLFFIGLPYVFAKVCDYRETARYNAYIKRTREGGKDNE